ncbi:hypothetical protein CHLNCDRAFT_57254 [Chlorella variabilis]|uniref:DM2 domain-containing protein n=1 Tax=Chlorella variabilis TaxID=554065 RepID=E1Z962_CHLVA|nr:hypothetical protein CHLNCDRAFT_57254 [Chlorella variabilis]EFN57724.1 hypothetical protein CHLNCDRAFT_57254 [Chlorella variabilis]|eukprot:XP_005849826.1 hypothetical protein CHLNCDRAFT_57254 [Chlorella variabilis]
MAANPALAAQFAAQQQAMMAQQARAMVAAQAAGRPGAPTASKSAHGAMKSAAAVAGPAAAGVVRAVEAVPAKKSGPGRKRKAMDQRLPDRGDLLIPDSPLFTQLQDAERRVDMLISRKKHELQEMYASFRRGPPGTAQAAGSARRKLRVYIRSEHLHQQNAADAAEAPSWVLTISGRLIGKDKAADAAAEEGGHGHHHKHAFTHYVRRLAVQLDPGLYPGESGRLVWDKALHDREQRDSIQLRRLGSRPCEATITLELDHQPVQYRLSSALAGALALRGLHSMPFVMQMLWGYIKAKQLYEPSDKGSVCVRCDERLRPLFGTDSVELGKMAEALKQHLTLPEPVKLQYTIKPDGSAAPHPDCYDFEVEVPLSTELPPYALKAGAGREVEGLDLALDGVLTRLAEHRRRRTYLLAFAQNPADFVQALVAAQGRELRLAASKEGEAYELMATGDVFRERWVDDCVMNHLARKQQHAVAQQAAALAEQQHAVLTSQHQQAAALAAAAVQQQAAAAALAAQQQAASAATGGAAGAPAAPSAISLQQQAAAQQALQHRLQQQQQAMGQPPRTGTGS